MIFIPTRNDIYSNEATEIISEISTYPGILEQQVYALHPGKEAQTRNLISYFIKQERIRRDKTPKPPMDSDFFVSRSRKRLENLTPEDCDDAECFEYCGQLLWNGF